MNDSSSLRRLFDYARPYRGRMLWAVMGMVLYAIGSAGLAGLIKPIFDSVLPNQQRLSFMAWAIVVLYLLKGVGSYVSAYLMADVGQRVVMDLRNALYRHLLGQSAGFFAQRTTGQLMSRLNNDVSQVQQVVSETAGDLARLVIAELNEGWIDGRPVIGRPGRRAPGSPSWTRPMRWPGTIAGSTCSKAWEPARSSLRRSSARPASLRGTCGTRGPNRSSSWSTWTTVARAYRT